MQNSFQCLKSVYFTSLGCSKNLVDGQVMLGYLGLEGFRATPRVEEAEVIVVNTCSFIEASKKESIDTILELADYKDPKNGRCQALVVAGCMAQRYPEALEKDLPEVDLIIGTGEYNKIAKLLRALEGGRLDKKSFVDIPKFIHTEFDPRINTSPKYMAWLKVSEGCNRNCTFCIIPTIRGRLRSRSVDSLVTEARALAQTGVKELNLISQDLSSYEHLYQLLDGLEKVDGIEWVRLFYYYPDDLTDQVIEKIASSKKVCKYLDMPVQHFSSNVLKRMNRQITGEKILSRVEKLRTLIPDIVIRTSIIVGFPGESEEDFSQLLEGVKKARFHHLGIFRYSDEEGTPAFKLGPKVPQTVIDERFDRLFEVQKQIAREQNGKYLKKTIQVLVEGPHEETELLWQGRHAGQAPDIDGMVIINDLGDEGKAIKLHPGDLISVEITDVLDYDLVGRKILNGQDSIKME